MADDTKDVLIARPGQRLHDHLEAVSYLSSKFSSSLSLPIAGELIGCLHDIGKASSAFQRYIRSASGLYDLESEDYVDSNGLRGKIDHSTAGAQLLWDGVSHSQPKAQDMLFAQMMALCICSHHSDSGLIDCLAPDGDRTFNKRMNKPEESVRLREATEAIGSASVARKHELLSVAVQEMRQRLATMIRPETSLRCAKCSLRGQNACRIPNPLAWFSLGLKTRMLFSCLIDADRTDSADNERPENVQLRPSGQPDWPKLIRLLEKRVSSFSGISRIDGIRREVSDYCHNRAHDSKGIFTLTVPTGGGKTLSGLRFALHHAAKHSMERIINVIPYTSIIDQNARVARSILEEGAPFGSIVLEHHSNLEPEKETARTRLASESWDVPVIYATMVQFLESLFRGGTRSVRRMHRLANAVILFDEIQTMPVECVHLFCNAVNFLIRECGSTVVLCTATQPLLDQVDSNLGALTLGPEREIAPSAERLFNELKRVEIKDDTRPEGWRVGEIAELAMRELGLTGSSLVVVNTKEWARDLFLRLARSGTQNLYHLSTDMCPAHRLRVLEEMRARLGKEPVQCVSTQLIEAGVDISFRSVIRFLAGLDSIVQAAGRCNRNGERPLGLVRVVNPSGENLCNLKTIRIGRDVSARVLSECSGSLMHPSTMERYFTYAFFHRSKEMAYPVKAADAGRDDNLTKSVSGEGDGSKRSSDTMGMKHRVDKGVYVAFGSMNPQLAEKTGFSDDDAKVIKQILPRLFENDASSARPEGSMSVAKVLWWEHNCKPGQYSSARVHGSLNVNPDGIYAIKELPGLSPEEIDGF